jgi:TetR/AcrR family transcriptional regulator, transcriptional repressor for nem operon
MKDTRDHILRTAFRLFVTMSYKAVTMSSLEKETGLTKGAFYHYFKNKEDIYIEVIDKFYLTNRDPKNDKNGSLLDNIELHFKHIESVSKKFKEIINTENFDPNAVALILEAKVYYPGFNEKLKELDDANFNKWESIISKAKTSGEIKSDIDTEILAENFIAIGYSIFRYIRNNGSMDFAITMLNRQYNQMYQLVKK